MTIPLLATNQLVLTDLLNDLAALPYRIILVLDDFHLVTGTPILEGLAFLLDHQPRQLHLVLSARADPPLPLARLRARGRLTEVRLDDLAFTVEEAVTFLNDKMGLGLPFHRSFQEDVAPVPAGEPFELVFDLLPTARRFRRGNRICLAITCADADNFDTPCLDPAPAVRLLRDAAHTSFVELPVLPAS